LFIKIKRDKPASSRAKVQKHREKLRAEGLLPIRISVTDTRSASFRARAKKQAFACIQCRASHPTGMPRGMISPSALSRTGLLN
jgi:hypothetical protein